MTEAKRLRDGLEQMLKLVEAHGRLERIKILEILVHKGDEDE